MFCFGQKQFVTFETTNKKTIVCQGKTMGVVATLITSEEGKNFKWAGDSINFKDVKNEVAIVNTATSGDKKLKFTLFLNENKNLDTVFTVSVLPNPKIDITYSKNILGFISGKDDTIVSYKWIYNGNILSDLTYKVIKNPSKGVYKVYVVDKNGCKATSKVFTVE